MTRTKELRFPVEVTWYGGPHAVAMVDGKPELSVATPPEFGSGVEGVWSPEDLLVASAATCYAVTLSAIARRRNLSLASAHVVGVGILRAGGDGQLCVTSIELDVDVRAESPEDVEAVIQAAERAERGCLVARALSVPVNVKAHVAVTEQMTPVTAPR